MATQATARISPHTAITLELEAYADNVMLVRQAVDGAARELGASGQTLSDIKLAVTEACANVVKHAYGGDSGTLQVKLSAGKGVVRIVVRDFGVWLPRVDGGADEITGMGIPLMEAVADTFEIRRLDPGTEIVLEFAIAGSDGTAAATFDGA